MFLQTPEAGRPCVALAALLLAAAACGGPTTPPARPSQVPAGAERLPADVVLDETNSGVEDASRLLIDATGEWASFHRRVFRFRSPTPERPEVDFGSAVIVAAAMGQRRTGGYGVAIEGVYLSGDTLYAEVAETSPGPQCVVTQALTAPVQAVRVPAPGADALLTVERSLEEDCG